MNTEDLQEQLQPQNQKYLTRFLKSPIFIASYIIVAIFCALLIQWSVKFITPKHILYGLGVSFLFTFLIIFMTVLLNRMRNQEALDEKLTDLSALIVNHKLNWIVNQKYMRMLELQSRETWIFAPELTFAIQTDSFIFEGTQRNLAKGAKYKFFIPDQPRIHKIVSDYKRIHKFEPGQVEFILLPHSEFVFHTAISLYNVGTDDISAVEWVPIRDLNTWIQMDKSHSERVAGIGQMLIRKHADHFVSLKEKPRAPLDKDSDRP